MSPETVYEPVPSVVVEDMTVPFCKTVIATPERAVCVESYTCPEMVPGSIGSVKLIPEVVVPARTETDEGYVTIPWLVALARTLYVPGLREDMV